MTLSCHDFGKLPSEQSITASLKLEPKSKEGLIIKRYHKEEPDRPRRL